MKISIFHKFRSYSRLGKVFFCLSIVIVLLILATYIWHVVEALHMDPHSYNCVVDSMMKDICQHPYSSSVSWTIIYLIFMGWPLTFPWIIIGLLLVRRRYLRLSHD
jgi:uncharacterized membrane protein YkgB